MLIEFVYRLPEKIVPLAQKDIVDFTDDRIIGYLDQGDVSRLSHCSLYMVCNLNTYNELNVISNPVGIVAPNEGQALDTYFKATENTNGMVFCSIVDDCSTVKVEPTGNTK